MSTIRKAIIIIGAAALSALSLAAGGCAKSESEPPEGSIPTLSAATSAEEESVTETAETETVTVRKTEPAVTTVTETEQTLPDTPREQRGDILVAYFSATENTCGIAERIAEELGCDIYRIIPDVPYTAEDLAYNDPNCRANMEMKYADARPAITGELPDTDNYDYIFLGYPIWFGQAPKIMCTFTESCGLSGKTVIPFCTSGSSDIGNSAASLARLAPEDSVWLDGRRFPAGASQEDISEWTGSLDIPRITDYKILYGRFLTALAKADEYKGHQYFDIYDIDGDGMPELFISPDDYHGARADIYTLWQGEVKELGDGYGSRGIVLAADNRYIDSSYTGNGSIFHSIFEKRGDEMINLRRFEYTRLEELICRVDDAEASEEEYNEAFAEYDLDWVEVGRKYPINAEGIKEALE